MENGNSCVNHVRVEKNEDMEGEAQLFALSVSYITSFAIRAACLLGIPDIINASPNQSISLHQIAQALHSHSHSHSKHYASPPPPVNEDHLFRLLRLLCAHGVFSSTSAFDPHTGVHENRYGLTCMSKWLLTTHNNRLNMRSLLLAMTDRITMEPTFSGISDSILDDNECSPFERFHGAKFWDVGKRNAHWNDSFNSAMESNTQVVVETILEEYDGFEDVGTLVDVGGGVGKALSMIRRKYPCIHGINYDLPHVLANAPSCPGIKHVVGDMFESIPQGDAIYMRGILHNWDDSACIKILKNCAKALPPNGKIIIVDVILDDEDTSKYNVSRLLLDFMMMIFYKSRERTLEEWKKLLAIGGFPRYNIVKIPNVQGLIEAFRE